MVTTLMLQMAVANLAWHITVSHVMLTLELVTHARQIMAFFKTIHDLVLIILASI